MRKPVALVAALAFMALSACASTTSVGSAASTTPAMSTEVTTARVGSPQTLSKDGETLTATVHAVTPLPFQDDDPVSTLIGPGMQATGVDVEVCISYQATVQAMDRWLLVDSLNGRYEPTTAAPSNLAPKYPYTSSPVSPGECVRGWVVFETPSDATLTTIRYSTSTGYTLKWDIAAS